MAKIESELKQACLNGSLSSLKTILSNKNLQVRPNWNQILIRVCASNQEQTLRLILADGRIDPSTDRNKAIIIASRNGHFNIVKLLLAERSRRSRRSRPK